MTDWLTDWFIQMQQRERERSLFAISLITSHITNYKRTSTLVRNQNKTPPVIQKYKHILKKLNYTKQTFVKKWNLVNSILTPRQNKIVWSCCWLCCSCAPSTRGQRRVTVAVLRRSMRCRLRWTQPSAVVQALLIASLRNWSTACWAARYNGQPSTLPYKRLNGRKTNRNYFITYFVLLSLTTLSAVL